MKYYFKKISLAVFWGLTGLSLNSFSAMAASAGAPSVQQAKKGRAVTGTVVDALDGTPIIGANIMLKGAGTGVISDLNGNFSIQVTGKRDVLVVTYIGYKKSEVLVEDLGVVHIKLNSDNEMLDEVIVVGSGTQKKVSVTGAISTIKGLELKSPNSSLTTSLAGRLAGVIAKTNTGEPGAASEFYIRGISTFGGRTTPLIILDDVEISSGDLNNIPAETIESFSILKDASATAIYGARGANGVMVVTTKKGKENTKARINITLENSVNMPINFPKFVDGATWMELYDEALVSRNPNGSPRYTNRIEPTRQGVNPYIYPDVDWGDLIFKEMSMNQRANINIIGGGSSVTYYMSLNVNHDTGLLDSPKLYSFRNNINKMAYNFQNNISIKVSPTTKIGLNMNAQLRNGTGPNFKTDELFRMALYANPVSFPAFYPRQEGDTHLNFGNAILSGNDLRQNPYAFMSTSFKQSDSSTLNVSLKIDQELEFITKGLSVNGLINFKNWAESSYNRSIQPYYYRVADGSYDTENPTDFDLERLGTSGTDYISESGISKGGDRTIAMQFQLNYARQFGLHNLGGMLMYMQRDYKAGVLPNRNQGVSGRFTYDYGQRYLVEFNFGYNGTERLSAGNRFEFFPAASIGWVMSNEDFFEPLRQKVDNLKLRASYGLVGSDETGTGASHFLYIDKITLGTVGFNTGDNWGTNMYGPFVNQYGIPGAGWERSKKLDVGIDMTLFRNWSITADYFNEQRYNILMQRAYWPSSLGYNTAKPWKNVGKVENWGVEFSTSYTHQLSKELSIDIRGNFTYTENKYKYKDEPDYPYPWKMETGRSLSSTWGYVADGLFQSQEEIDNSPRQELGSTPGVGDIKYRDLNGDGVINKYDEAMISEFGTMPRIQYGLGVNLKYKKFDIGVFFNGSAMRKIAINNGWDEDTKKYYDIYPFGEADRNIFKFIADDHWTEENPNAAYPRLGLTKNHVANNEQNSSYWLRNGNFIRFKTLELGYNFKMGRVYLNGDNLAVFSPFKEWDPEISWFKYPLQRAFNLGLQLNF